MARLAEHSPVPPQDDSSDVSQSDDHDESDEESSALSHAGYGQGYAEWDEAVDPDSVRAHLSFPSTSPH